ncbi:MAG: hypothetical protein QM479_03080 [Pseudomonadota bacterium]
MDQSLSFFDELNMQRWDDHRYYHHNRINQFLHFLSAICFLSSYVLIFINPVLAILIGWLGAMVLRQVGHFFFEPKIKDLSYDVSHEYKESVKVGYNLYRKIILLSLWGLSTLAIVVSPSLFGLLDITNGFLYNLAMTWLFVGLSALIFRSVHLFFIMGIQSGFVWLVKILTDPFHDIKIYYKSLHYIMKGEMYDQMTDWYDPSLVKNA